MTSQSTRPVTEVPAVRRPGWPEVAVAAAVYVLLLLVLPRLVGQLVGDDGAARGLAFAALSGVLGLAAFYGAFALRLRDHASFGVSRVSWRWVLIGALLGVAAIVVTRLLTVLLFALGVDVVAADPQGDYRDAASSGALGLVLNVLLLGVLTGVGEELAFRGVLTNALRRFGPWVAVVAGTVVFALAHGLNLALVPAVVVGLIASILFVRSGSVWPGVAAHVVNNGLGQVITVALTALLG